MKIKNFEFCAERRIFEAAKSAFIGKGFDGASMEDIAAVAGMTRTSLNYYFRSKEKLFSAVFREIIGGFIPKVESAALAKAPIFKRMEKVVKIYTEMLLKNPEILIFMANESNKNPCWSAENLW